MLFDFLGEHYLVIKSLHIIFVICWMAGLFYLPRLLAYHVVVSPESEMASTFTTMEQRLIRIIITPAMLATFFFGIGLVMVPGMMSAPFGWLHVKILLVLLLAAYNGYMILCHKECARGIYRHSSKTFRLLNEVPPIVMVLIIFLVVIKPF